MNLLDNKISNVMERLRSLLSCDICDYGLKDNRPCLLPAHLCRTKKEVFYGRKLLAKSIKTNPLPIQLPSLSSRKFVNSYVQTQEIRLLIQKLEESARNVHKLVIAYRFFPHHSSYINHEFHITNNVRDRLKHLYNALGLTLNRVPFMVHDMFSYTRKGIGISGLANENYEKVLVEVITFMNGEYGRFLLLVSLGVSCTVWYIFAPGVADCAPPVEIFPRELTYSKFFESYHYDSKFHKIFFLEQKYITGEVLSALENVFPFSEIDIPVNTNVDVPETSNTNLNERHNLKVAVGFGLIVAVFLTLGIIPTTLNDEL